MPEFDVPGHAKGFSPLESQGMNFCSNSNTHGDIDHFGFPSSLYYYHHQGPYYHHCYDNLVVISMETVLIGSGVRGLLEFESTENGWKQFSGLPISNGSAGCQIGRNILICGGLSSVCVHLIHIESKKTVISETACPLRRVFGHTVTQITKENVIFIRGRYGREEMESKKVFEGTLSKSPCFCNI